MIMDFWCEGCQHALVCSIKEKHLDKFTLGEDEKKFTGVDIQMIKCKSFDKFKNDDDVEDE